MITLTLPLSLGSESDLLAAYQAAGGKIDGAMDVIATGTTVNCAGDPPRFPMSGLTALPTSSTTFTKVSLPLLVVSWRCRWLIRSIKAGPRSLLSSASWVATSLLVPTSLSGTVAPGNEAAFNAVCPEGRLVFLEKYHDADGKLAVVYLFAYEGRVHLSFSALNDDEFGPKFHFAVRCTPSSNNT